MKEMIDSEKTSNILIGVGLVGLLAYGYMLIFSEISPEDLKYSVLACSFAAFLPFAITIRKITTDYSTGSFWGIVIVVAAIFSFVAYSMMKATEEGFLFDLFAVVSSEGFRWLYLSLLVISTLLPFIWEKGAPYVLAIALGVIIPVILYTIIILVVILIGCYVLSLFGKSNNTSSSLGSLFTSSPKTSNIRPVLENKQAPPKPVNTNVVDKKSSNAISKEEEEEKRRRDREIDFLTTGWTYGTARFKGKSPSRCLDRGGVMIWYNGELNQKTSIGTTEVYEATGDICVVFPKNYRGRDIQFYSTNGIVQIQSL